MPYTPPNTFVATQPITEAQVDGNLTAVQSYVNGGVVSADLYTGAAFKLNQQNIARGHYNPINNSLQMVSGIAAGHHSGAMERSFVVGAPTSMNSPTSPQDVNIQNSSITFFVEKQANCLFQFHMTPIFVPAGALAATPGLNPVGSAAIYVDTLLEDHTRVWTRREVEVFPVPPPPPTSSPAFPHYRNPWSGFITKTNLTAGWHSIGLQGRTFGHYIMNVAWGVTLEIYY